MLNTQCPCMLQSWSALSAVSASPLIICCITAMHTSTSRWAQSVVHTCSHFAKYTRKCWSEHSKFLSCQHVIHSLICFLRQIRNYLKERMRGLLVILMFGFFFKLPVKSSSAPILSSSSPAGHGMTTVYILLLTTLITLLMTFMTLFYLVIKISALSFLMSTSSALVSFKVFVKKSW